MRIQKEAKRRKSPQHFRHELGDVVGHVTKQAHKLWATGNLPLHRSGSVSGTVEEVRLVFEARKFQKTGL